MSKLEASANHSSEKERILPPRVADTKSVKVLVGDIQSNHVQWRGRGSCWG